jgi:hypothetical protein
MTPNNNGILCKFGGQIHMAICRNIMTTTEPPLLAPLPFQDLHWTDFPGCFNGRSIRRVHKYHDEIIFASFPQKMYVLVNMLRNNMQTQITGVELSTLFDHSGGGVQGMISLCLHSPNSENPTARGRPKQSISIRRRSSYNSA